VTNELAQNAKNNLIR